ncbi:MAG: hypothetical protein QM737_01545 [Ferruginibacter sp.]
MFDFLKNKTFILFVIKFLLVFLVCYYGTVAVIGLTVPDGPYSPFITKYMDYVSWLRNSLLAGTKWMLSAFGVETFRVNYDTMRKVGEGGRGIRLAYSCLGYGVMSFWIAYVVASAGSFKKKLFWVFIGWFFIWLLNITRLSLLLMANNKGWAMPLGIDHHSWFTFFAYLFILIFMLLFNRQTKEQVVKPADKK